MKKITLQTKLRTKLSKKVKEVRKKDFVPAVAYGPDQKNINLAVDYKEFAEAFEEAGTSTIIDLNIDDQKKAALIYDYQLDPITNRYLHVDFYLVSMDKELEAEVELEFIGTSKAVKDEEGVLVKNFDSIEVKALPQDLPPVIKVDIGSLETFDDVITAKDLDVSDKVELLIEPDEVVATVTPPRSEEELAELDEEVTEDVEEVEGVKEEEPEEGAAEGEAETEGEEPAEKPAEEGAAEEKPTEEKKEEK